MKKLYFVNYILNNKKVYDASYGFHNEPTEDDLRAIIRTTNPSVEFDKIEWTYVRELRQNEL